AICSISARTSRPRSGKRPSWRRNAPIATKSRPRPSPSRLPERVRAPSTWARTWIGDEMTKEVKIKIDDKEYTVPSNWTVIKACHENGIDVPHYCYHPDLPI